MYSLLSHPFRRITILAFLIGVCSGLGSLLFYNALEIFTTLVMQNGIGFDYPIEGEEYEIALNWAPPDILWLFVPVLVIGGLITGYLVYRFCPETKTHGTDTAIDRYHHDGRIDPLIPLVKGIASVITIGTGGSAGREGPGSLIGAGIGSYLADLMHLSPSERRLAVAIGIGAGIGSIFKTPLGGAVLAAEILYKRDVDLQVLYPALVASLTGYIIFGLGEGFGYLFDTGDLSWSVPQLGFFILLGVISAPVGILYCRVFYATSGGFEAFFRKYHLPAYLRPASGAFLFGIVLLAVSNLIPGGETAALGSVGTGYGFIQLMLYNLLPLEALLLIPFVKIIATSLTIGSGGSGGTFTPGLLIGASTGAACGTIFHLFFPDLVPADSIPVFALIGMVALFGGIAHAPIAVMIMTFEMTGSLALLVPATLAVLVSVLLTRDTTIFHTQVTDISHSGAHRGAYSQKILRNIRIQDIMFQADTVRSVPPDIRSSEITSLMGEGGVSVIPVVEEGRILGILRISDIGQDEERILTAGDLMDRWFEPVFPMSDAEEAIQMMVRDASDTLVVVDPSEPERFLGLVTRDRILVVMADNHP